MFGSYAWPHGSESTVWQSIYTNKRFYKVSLSTAPGFGPQKLLRDHSEVRLAAHP